MLRKAWQGATTTVRLVIFGAALTLLAFTAWFVLIRPTANAEKAATAKTEAIIADTQRSAAQDTIRIVVDHNAAVQTINTRTEVTTRDILQAPGASDAIDPALHAAGLRALCLHDNRRDPTCAALLHGAGDSERAD